LVRRGKYDETYWLGANFNFFPQEIASFLRVPAGHHEDFFEALANLHCSLERDIRGRRGESVLPPYPFPDAETGVAGMRFIAAAVKSSQQQGVWTAV
jgi:hypothetical protein